MRRRCCCSGREWKKGKRIMVRESRVRVRERERGGGGGGGERDRERERERRRRRRAICTVSKPSTVGISAHLF